MRSQSGLLIVQGSPKQHLIQHIGKYGATGMNLKTSNVALKMPNWKDNVLLSAALTA